MFHLDFQTHFRAKWAPDVAQCFIFIKGETKHVFSTDKRYADSKIPHGPLFFFFVPFVLLCASNILETGSNLGRLISKRNHAFRLHLSIDFKISKEENKSLLVVLIPSASFTAYLLWFSVCSLQPFPEGEASAGWPRKPLVPPCFEHQLEGLGMDSSKGRGS